MNAGFGLLVETLVPDPRRLAPNGGLPGSNLFGKVEIKQARPGPRAALQVVDVEDTVRVMRDDGVGHAFLADQRRQGARIDAADRDNPAPFQPMVEVAPRAIARRPGNVGLENCANRAVTGGRAEVFDVFVVGADIADMRKREGDDLAGIGRIGQNLLIAGKRGVEADFGDDDSRRAEPAAFDQGPVGKHQQCRWLEFSPARGL